MQVDVKLDVLPGLVKTYFVCRHEIRLSLFQTTLQLQQNFKSQANVTNLNGMMVVRK